MKTQHLLASSILMATMSLSIANAQLVGGSGAVNGGLNGTMGSNLAAGHDMLSGAANTNMVGNAALNSNHATDKAGALSSRASSQAKHATEQSVSKLDAARNTAATSIDATKDATTETSMKAKSAAETAVTAAKEKTTNAIDHVKPTAEVVAATSVDTAYTAGSGAKNAAQENNTGVKQPVQSPLERSQAATGNTTGKEKTTRETISDASTKPAVTKPATSLQQATTQTVSANASPSGASAQRNTDTHSRLQAGRVDSGASTSTGNSVSVEKSDGKANGSGSVNADVSSTH